MSKIFDRLKKAEYGGLERPKGRIQGNLNLSTMADEFISERQIRPLARLEPEQQIKVRKEGVETVPAGKVTAKPQEQIILEETEEIIKNSPHLEMTHEWLRERRGGDEKTWASIRKHCIRWEPVLEATNYVVYVSPDR